jgi:hypothetical protein
MSYIFDVNGVTVWSPALEVGEAYVRCALALGAAFGVEPGFDVISEDMVDLDLDAFQGFADRLGTIAAKAHGQVVLHDLIDAVLAPSLVMLERAGVSLDLLEDARVSWRVGRLRGMPQ